MRGNRILKKITGTRPSTLKQLREIGTVRSTEYGPYIVTRRTANLADKGKKTPEILPKGFSTKQGADAPTDC